MQRNLALADLLCRKQLMEQLRALVQRAVELAQNSMNSDESAGPLKRALFDWVWREIQEQLRDCFHEHFLAVLPLPSPVTVSDLMNSARLTLLDPTEDFDTRLSQFRRIIGEMASVPRRTKPFPILSGYFWHQHTEISGSPTANQPVLWTDVNGFRLVLVGTLPTSDEYDDVQGDGMYVCSRRVVYARAEATCTHRALRAFRRDVQGALRTVLKSLELLKQLSDNPPRKGCWPFEPLTIDSPSAPDLSSGEGRNECWVIEPLLEAFFTKSQKKDSMDRRLRNALHLLVESDRQQHAGIALSLSMSAIESLLCRHGSDITNQVAENSATLLEPDARRRADAVKFVKRHYEARSRTLHGELLEHEHALRRDARMLASGVLVAILERRDFQRRAGIESETPDALLGELRDSKYGDGEIPGVSPSPLRQLWQKQL